MREIVYINEFNAGACFLVKGEISLVIDPGMAWCGKKTISLISDEIGDGPLGAIFLTHSHYDHVGALPYFRKKWPEATVYAGERALEILRKDSAREMMIRLSKKAAAENDSRIEEDYDPELLYADRAIYEGDVLKFADTVVRAVETPGHTKDSMSYFVDESILMSSESMGFYNCDDTYNPQYLVSFKDCKNSLLKSRSLKPQRIYIPHNGCIDKPDEAFWDYFEEGIEESYNFMQKVLRDYPTQEERLKVMEDRYWHPERYGGWPQEAYDVNAVAMLKTVAREAGIE